MNNQYTPVMKKLPILLIILCQVALLKGQLQSGPMLGYADFKEVAIWLQTTEAADVQIEYHPKNNHKEIHYTQSHTTRKMDAFTATLIADKVVPGTTYF